MSKLGKLRWKLLARLVEMDVAAIRLLLEADGWTRDRIDGSPHHSVEPGEDVITRATRWPSSSIFATCQ